MDFNQNQITGRYPSVHQQTAPNKMANTSFLCGVLSLVTLFLCPALLPMLFGSLAIILAILSKGYDKHMSRIMRHAFILGMIGLISYIILVGQQSYRYMNDSAYRKQINHLYEEFYNQGIRDMPDDLSN